MVKQFNSNNFEKEVLKADQVVLVDFYSNWCPPCRIQAPIIEELSEEYKDKINIGKFNVEDDTEITQQYGIMSIPTLIFFKNGKEVQRLIGLHSKEVLEEEINKLLKQLM